MNQARIKAGLNDWNKLFEDPQRKIAPIHLATNTKNHWDSLFPWRIAGMSSFTIIVDSKSIEGRILVGEGAPTSTPDSNARTLSETTPVRVEYSPACQKLRSNGHGRSWSFPKAKAANGGSSATSPILEEDGSLLALIVGRYRELCGFFLIRSDGKILIRTTSSSIISTMVRMSGR